jgi:hypothetical protein
MMLRWRRLVPGIIFVALAANVPLGAAVSPATIVNSGSTNTLGFTIQVTPDGGATLTMQHATKSFHVAGATLKTFFADLSAARRLTTSPQSGCMKSASFGSATRIAWQGWTSPDLECPAPNAQIAALTNDVHAIREAAGIAGPTLHSRASQSEPPALP